MKNSGFTLIEMILALALASFVALGVMTLMLNSSKSYNNTISELELQSNAQIVMNTVTDRILEGNNAYFDDVNKLLTIYHSDSKDMIWYESSTRKMYLFITTTEAQENEARGKIEGLVAGLEEHLLADFVDSFESSQTSVTGTADGLIDITLKFSKYGKNYTLKNNVRLRNQIAAIP